MEATMVATCDERLEMETGRKGSLTEASATRICRDACKKRGEPGENKLLDTSDMHLCRGADTKAARERRAPLSPPTRCTYQLRDGRAFAVRHGGSAGSRKEGRMARLGAMTKSEGKTHSRVNRRRSSFLAWSEMVAGPGSASQPGGGAIRRQRGAEAGGLPVQGWASLGAGWRG